ncbi:NHLP leader peptide family RiPP precursor [Deltaproteobacteria bacterium TL4]
MKQYEEIVQRCWNEEDFKERLVRDPKTVIAELGVELGNDVTIEVHDDSSDTMNFVLLDRSQLKDVPISAETPAGKVMIRAYQDENYKARLLSESRSAIQEVLGIEPQGNIKIHENTPRHIHLVLPANPNKTGELSDTDLSMVAGGKITDDIVDGINDAVDAVGDAVGGVVNDVVGGVTTLAIGAVLGSGYTAYLNKLMGPLMVGWNAFKGAANQV